jgi:hypothetical protein
LRAILRISAQAKGFTNSPGANLDREATRALRGRGPWTVRVNSLHPLQYCGPSSVHPIHLKVSYEYLDPDDSISEDHQVRWSLLWEYTPSQFLQGRFGARHYDGIPQVDFQNRDEFFVELHGFF